MRITLAIVVLLGLGIALWASERSVRRRVLSRMGSRRPRTPEEFGRDFFPPERAGLATKVREVLARHLAVDLARLSPEDSFIDLEMAELDSMATVGFVLDLEREFDIKIADKDAERLKTFRDVVEYVDIANRRKTA